MPKLAIQNKNSSPKSLSGNGELLPGKTLLIKNSRVSKGSLDLKKATVKYATSGWLGSIGKDTDLDFKIIYKPANKVLDSIQFSSLKNQTGKQRQSIEICPSKLISYATSNWLIESENELKATPGQAGICNKSLDQKEIDQSPQKNLITEPNLDNNTANISPQPTIENIKQKAKMVSESSLEKATKKISATKNQPILNLEKTTSPQSLESLDINPNILQPTIPNLSLSLTNKMSGQANKLSAKNQTFRIDQNNLNFNQVEIVILSFLVFLSGIKNSYSFRTKSLSFQQ